MNKESLEQWLNDETYIMAYRFNYDSAREFNEELKQYVRQLQQRIDKAIEYNDYFKKSTEEQKELGQDNSFIVSSYLGVFHDMMNDILRGKDNE